MKRGSAAWPARAAVVAAAIAASLFAVDEFRGWLAAQSPVRQMLDDSGLPSRQPEQAREILREPDPARAGLALARSLFVEVLDRRTIAKLPWRQAAAEVSREGEKLRISQELAAAAWVARPAAGEAAMVLGGASYLELARADVKRLEAERGAWNGPLEAARRLAPAEPESLRLLAVAALERWPRLEAGARGSELALLRHAFSDQQALAAMINAWLRIADDRELAFRAIPDTAQAWETVARALARRGDWPWVAKARERADGATEREVERLLADATARFAGGDVRGARAAAVTVLIGAPPDLRFAERVARALRICPPGPPDVATEAAAKRWLSWAVDGYVRGRELLPPATVARLRGLAGELPPALAATAELAAGQLARAEVLERRSEALALEGWAPYCVAKARVLAERGDPAAARAVLAGVHRSWRDTPPELAARLAVARASGDAAASAEIERQLGALAVPSLQATAWRWRGAVAQLDLVLVWPSPGLEVAIDVIPARGGVVALVLDHRRVLASPVEPGKVLKLVAPLDPGCHLLEFEGEEGGRIMPGSVTVLP